MRPDDGILPAKKALNALHQYMSTSDMDEFYLHHMSENIMAVTRQCPITLKSVVLVAHLVCAETRCSYLT